MPKAFEILLVEDNAADAYLTRTVIEDGPLAVNVSSVADGVEALALLRRESTRADAAPDLILFDLNMPRKGGREFLAELRADSALRCIPIVVLTTSDSQQDIRA